MIPISPNHFVRSRIIAVSVTPLAVKIIETRIPRKILMIVLYKKNRPVLTGHAPAF